MYKVKIAVTPSGTTGSATSSTTVTLSRPGYLNAVYLSYYATAGTTCEVRLRKPSAPAATYFYEVGKTSQWFFPRLPINTSTGFALSTGAELVKMPVIDSISLHVGTSNPFTDCVVGYVFIDEE